MCEKDIYREESESEVGGRESGRGGGTVATVSGLRVADA